MEGLFLKLPDKLKQCRELGHELVEMHEGTKTYYACKSCHCVFEVNCEEAQVMVS